MEGLTASAQRGQGSAFTETASEIRMLCTALGFFSPSLAPNIRHSATTAPSCSPNGSARAVHASGGLRWLVLDVEGQRHDRGSQRCVAQCKSSQPIMRGMRSFRACIGAYDCRCARLRPRSSDRPVLPLTGRSEWRCKLIQYAYSAEPRSIADYSLHRTRGMRMTMLSRQSCS